MFKSKFKINNIPTVLWGEKSEKIFTSKKPCIYKCFDNLNKKSINISGLITAVNLVVEPVLIAATVRIVAAEPGSEPVKPQIIFPTPCPNSILFDEVFVFNKESETKTVNKLSDDRTIASVTA